MTSSIFLVILITSLATYLSRFLGAFTSEKISEKSNFKYTKHNLEIYGECKACKNKYKYSK